MKRYVILPFPIRAELSGSPGRIGRKVEMTCCSAAVGPTSDSALPFRAKLSEDPNIVGTWFARLIAAPLNQRGDDVIMDCAK